MRHVVVVGGGIAGLAAAFELTGGGAGSSPAAPSVTVLDAGALGGKLVTTDFDGVRVDVGPDGFLSRRPEAAALVGELGGTDALEPIGAQGAWVYARGGLRRLPAGLALGVPTRLRDLRRSDTIGMLGIRGALRAAVDLVAPRRASRSALPDRAIGPLVGDKLGRRVVDVLVDPLIGGIHAGRVRDLSAAAVFPPLLAAGQARGSMMRALQTATGDGPKDHGPAFLTLRDGLGSLVALLARELVARGVTCQEHETVLAIRRGPAGASRWIVDTAASSFAADAIVLATPPAPTAALLETLDANAAGLARGIDTASVVVVTLRYKGDGHVLPEGTGVLVPSGTPGPDGTFLTTAVSFSDRKWPHLARAGETLLRASMGRIDDHRAMELDDPTIVAQVGDELGAILGMEEASEASLVTRWPDSFPQYRVNHLVRVDGIEGGVRALGGVAVAGASYRGVGIPACIGSGRAAARAVRAWLADQS